MKKQAGAGYFVNQWLIGTVGPCCIFGYKWITRHCQWIKGFIQVAWLRMVRPTATIWIPPPSWVQVVWKSPVSAGKPSKNPATWNLDGPLGPKTGQLFQTISPALREKSSFHRQPSWRFGPFLAQHYPKFQSRNHNCFEKILGPGPNFLVCEWFPIMNMAMEKLDDGKCDGWS